MVDRNAMQSEIEVLAEKIRTYKHLLKDTRPEKCDINNFMNRKLKEYKHRYLELSEKYMELYDEAVLA